MREESGSDEDAEEPEDWEDDGEASSEEDESDEEARVSNAQRGRVRLHPVSARQQTAWRSTTTARRKSLGEKGWAHAGRLWCVVWSRVAQLSWTQRLFALIKHPFSATPVASSVQLSTFAVHL